MYVIVFNHPTAGRFYHGRGHRPVTACKQAIRFKTQAEAQVRVASLQREFQVCLDLDQELIRNVSIVYIQGDAHEKPDVRTGSRQ